MSNTNQENRVSEQFKSFIMERYEECWKKANQDPEYIKLRNQSIEAVHDLLSEGPEIKQKYSVLETIEGLIEGEVIVRAYLQGMKDATSLQQLLT